MTYCITLTVWSINGKYRQIAKERRFLLCHADTLENVNGPFLGAVIPEPNRGPYFGGEAGGGGAPWGR